MKNFPTATTTSTATTTRKEKLCTYLIVETVLGDVVFPQSGASRLEFLQSWVEVKCTPVQMSDDDATFYNFVQSIVESDGKFLWDKRSRGERARAYTSEKPDRDEERECVESERVSARRYLMIWVCLEDGGSKSFLNRVPTINDGAKTTHNGIQQQVLHRQCRDVHLAVSVYTTITATVLLPSIDDVTDIVTATTTTAAGTATTAATAAATATAATTADATTTPAAAAVAAAAAAAAATAASTKLD